MLTPLPWKLTDDLSIWTQMWPWTPVPEDGEVTYEKSVCTLCPGGCGIKVRKVGNRAVKIEGMDGHPVNEGGVCLLGVSGLQFLYGPTRVKTPLMRVGERGSGKWKSISWTEAIGQIADKLNALRDSEQAHTVACISGAGRGTVSALLERFLSAYGSPNFLSASTYHDAYRLALKLTQGADAGAGFDFENSDYVLSFGAGLFDGWGAPVRMLKTNAIWQESGTTFVQVEPRLSNTAAKADQWVPIEPGTEAALALGIAHVMIKERIYNREFVNGRTFGFDDWKDENGRKRKGFKRMVLDGYSPETVAGITGIEPQTIVALAKGFAAAKKPLAVFGRGQGLTPGGMNEFMAVQALNALAGSINAKGGVASVADAGYIDWPALNADPVAAAGLATPRIDGAGSEEFPLVGSLINRFAAAVDAGKDYPINVLMVAGANPLFTLPDSKLVKRAVDKIPFLVSFSSYMDETAAYADLILPNHVYLERYEDVPTPFGMTKPVVGLSKPVVSPLYNTRNTGDVVLSLAQAMGGPVADAFPWEDYKTCLRQSLGNRWNDLVENGFALDRYYKMRMNGNGRSFDTPSKKFEFFGGGSASPEYRALKVEGDESSYKLVLVPYTFLRLASGAIGNPPFVTKAVDDTVLKGNDVVVEVNPKTARSLKLREGKDAILSTPRGEVTVKVHLYEGIKPGVIAMPTGLGHQAYDEYLADKGANINELIGPVVDPASGLDAAWGIRAKLSKA